MLGADDYTRVGHLLLLISESAWNCNRLGAASIVLHGTDRLARSHGSGYRACTAYEFYQAIGLHAQL